MPYPFDEDPEMSDEEHADLMQATQEQPTTEELDRMFIWWERERGF